MIVLHVSPYFAPAWSFGGVCRAVTDLARTQVRMGHRPLVLTTDARSRSSRLPAGEDRVDGIPVVRVRNLSLAARARLNLSTPVGFASALTSLLETYAPDVVHCHELRTIETLQAVRTVRRRQTAVVLSPHGTLPHATGRSRAKQLWDLVFTARMLPVFDGVVALTSAERADVEALWRSHGAPLEPARIPVVPNGVDPDAFAGRPPREEARARWGLGRGPVVLFMGRLTPRKNLPLLVGAFADAATSLPEARLLVAGPDEGDDVAARAAAARPGAAGRVVFAGAVDGADRLAAFAAADLFALPAVGEGFPVAALEALACGIPVVLSPECHFPEAAAAGAGLIVEPARERLAAVLSELLPDRPRLSAMGVRARDLARRQYAWTRVAADIEAGYRAAIAWRQTHPR